MKYLLVLFLTILSYQAIALDIPRRSKQDHRVQYVNYDSSDVTKVNAANGYVTTIIFQEGEKVTNYGSGYSTAWEFSTANNYFFLKPKDKEGTTNLVVVTNKRVYSFDVNLVSKQQNATYKLTFLYPQDDFLKKQQEREHTVLDNLLKKNNPNRVKLTAHVNYDYFMNFGETENSKLISPVEAFDDGFFTYLKFKNNTDFPVTYSVNSDGEALVNSHVEDGYLVIHGVFSELRLRAGQDVVGLYNNSFTGGSNDVSDNGTTVKDLIREIKE